MKVFPMLNLFCQVSPIYETVSMKKLQQGIPSASLKQTQQSRQHNVTPASSSQESLTLVGEAIPDSTKATVFSSSGSSASGGKGDEDTDSDSHLYGAVGPHTEPCLRQKSADARGDLNLIISPRKSVRKVRCQSLSSKTASWLKSYSCCCCGMFFDRQGCLNTQHI